jgi:adenylate cyclase
MALLILAGAIAAFLVVSIKRFWLLIVAVAGLAVGLVLLSLAVFTFGHILPLLYLLVDVALVFGSMLAFQYITESREKRFIRESFHYYLSPAVVGELLRDPKKLALGGEKRMLTILFSDIRGFTTVSEALSPEALVELMNEYLTAMTDIIMEHRGLVDKYIGDAVMAFWGAPLDNPDHAGDACRAAAAMLIKLEELNKGWQARGIPHIAIGIGISTGEVVVGNIGSAKRFNYTIMGDEVNFASRLEGITKMYGTSCLVSGSVVQALEARKNGTTPYVLREVDTVTVKGKTAPKTIFELAPDDKNVAGGMNTQERFKKFGEGLAAYREGRFDAATSIFESTLAKGEDGPSATLLARSKEFQQHAPPEWKGVYEFHTK